jgi:hypothetical protein
LEAYYYWLGELQHIWPRWTDQTFDSTLYGFSVPNSTRGELEEDTGSTRQYGLLWDASDFQLGHRWMTNISIYHLIGLKIAICYDRANTTEDTTNRLDIPLDTM